MDHKRSDCGSVAFPVCCAIGAYVYFRSTRCDAGFDVYGYDVFAYLACNGELHVNEPSLLSYISDTGFLQVRYVYYVEESRELQLTVYYNARDPMAQTLPEDTLFPFDIVLNLNSGGGHGV